MDALQLSDEAVQLNVIKAEVFASLSRCLSELVASYRNEHTRYQIALTLQTTILDLIGTDFAPRTYEIPPAPEAFSSEKRPTGSEIQDVVQYFISELYRSRQRRFQWMKLCQQDFQAWAQRREVWDKAVGEVTSSLQTWGYHTEADMLSSALRADRNVSRPGHFDVIMTTGYGQEKMRTTVEGRDLAHDSGAAAHDETQMEDSQLDETRLDETRMDETRMETRPGSGYSESRLLPQRGRAGFGHDALQLDVLADPAPVDLDPADMKKSRPQDVTSWLSWIKPGLALAWSCPCPWMIVPCISLSAVTHVFVQRCFHVDPLDGTTALDHFATKHGLAFSGVEEMFKSHGVLIQAERLTRAGAAQNNYTMSLMYEEAKSAWGDLATSDETQRSATRPPIPDVTRTVSHESALLAGAHSFRWPPDHPTAPMWVVCCPHPQCTAWQHGPDPWEGGTAIHHFRQHGFQVQDEYDVLSLFGFKILPIQVDPITNLPIQKCAECSTHKRVCDRAVPTCSGCFKRNTDCRYSIGPTRVTPCVQCQERKRKCHHTPHGTVKCTNCARTQSTCSYDMPCSTCRERDLECVYPARKEETDKGDPGSTGAVKATKSSRPAPAAGARKPTRVSEPIPPTPAAGGRRSTRRSEPGRLAPNASGRRSTRLSEKLPRPSGIPRPAGIPLRSRPPPNKYSRWRREHLLRACQERGIPLPTGPATNLTYAELLAKNDQQ